VAAWAVDFALDCFAAWAFVWFATAGTLWIVLPRWVLVTSRVVGVIHTPKSRLKDVDVIWPPLEHIQDISTSAKTSALVLIWVHCRRGMFSSDGLHLLSSLALINHQLD